MTTVVVIEGPEHAGRALTIEQPILGDGVDIVRAVYCGVDSATVQACRNAEVVLTDYVPFLRAVMEQLPRLKLISVAATGYDNIDIAAARDQGIRVCAIDEYCTDEVADHALMLMLALGRRLMDYHAQIQEQHRWQFDSFNGLPRFSDLTLGVIGFGRIGRAVAKRAVAFGMSVVVHDPFVEEASFSLDEVLAQSDIVTLHCSLSADTRNLIDKSAFRKMHKAPMLINVARGGLIVEADLVWALDEGLVSAAGLDVLQKEPPDLEQSALTGRPNVIVTPHVAFYSDASIRQNRSLSAQNIRYFLDGNDESVRKYVGNT
jgi:D-3-phosphoglycerate dehydrogenase